MISDTWRRESALQKPEGFYRIVCFGASTTAHRVGREHYPLLLQQKLRSVAGHDNIEVINVGNSAYATPHSIILLALDVLSWQPDMVILSHNINDLTVLYFPGLRHDYWNKYQNDYYALPDFSARYSWNNVVFQHSRLYWFVADLLEQRRQKRAERDAVLNRQIPFNRATFQMGKDIFRRNVRTFVKMAQAADIKVILGTQPHELSEAYFMRHMAHKPYNDVAVYPSHAEHIEFHAAYNTVIREVAEETGAILVDNERIMNGNPDYFIDHVHNSIEGLRALAVNYGEAIIRNHHD
ncbi:MAG: GDSL-type esterase/lipase family protein [Lentisphaerae bacterium]|nr:GDSL-type esterase/lipase family protein [Lentisphaerota bacterium]